MTITAKYPEIVKSIVVILTVYMIHLQWNWFPIPCR